jgi:hypothetical protein
MDCLVPFSAISTRSRWLIIEAQGLLIGLKNKRNKYAANGDPERRKSVQVR